MSIRSIGVFLFSAFAALALPSLSYGAAQLKAGAKTSAQPTSTNPQLRQIQITFDPDVVPDEVVTTGGGSFNVTGFQLSVQFSAGIVSVLSPNNIQLQAPYSNSITSSVAGANPAATTSGGPTVDNSTGLVSAVGGHAFVGTTSPGDVNIFSIIFTLDNNISLDQIMSFTIFAQTYGASVGASPAVPSSDDFVQGTDPVTGNTIFTPAAGVIPTTITGSFNSFSAQIAAAAVPLPMGAWAGMILLALLAGWVQLRGVGQLAE
jgi:hypothetical protein